MARSPGPTPTAGSPLPMRPSPTAVRSPLARPPLPPARTRLPTQPWIPASIRTPAHRRHGRFRVRGPVEHRGLRHHRRRRGRLGLRLEHVTANASVGMGIEQRAYAAIDYGTATANVALTNAGSISVGASANAFAGGPGIFGDDNPGNGQGHCACRYRHFAVRHRERHRAGDADHRPPDHRRRLTSRSTSTPVRDPHMRR